MQALATGIPVILLAWWLLKAVGALWRRQIWREVGRSVRAIEAEIRGVVRPRPTGWRVQSADKAIRVEWLGTLSGPITRLRVRVPVGHLTVRRRGWLGRREVSDELARIASAPGPGP